MTAQPAIKRWDTPSSVPERVPEPMVMDDEAQVAAYVEGSRNGGPLEPGHVLFAARASQALAGCRRVLDLGCGPAYHLSHLARLCPDKEIVGVDLSEAMLRNGRERLDSVGATNVQLERADMTELTRFEDNSFDGVTSSFALHQLPTLDHLSCCFAEARRVLRPGGSVFFFDIGRLGARARWLFRQGTSLRADDVLLHDFDTSLAAAFTTTELSRTARAHGLPGRVHASALVRAVLIMESPRRAQPTREQRDQLRQMRAQLRPGQRRVLDAIRAIIRLGGLRGDPFPVI